MGNCIKAELAKEMDGSVRQHRFRYHLAKGFITPTDRVLDIGSGSGYGADMYSDVSMDVTGIELEEDEVKAASERYPFIRFICGNLEEMELPKCDVASAFEILEHLYKPNEFIQKLKKATSKYIIFSVPTGQKLIVVNGDPQEETDSTHHSVFKDGDEIMEMFVDDDWKEFFRIQLGVTFLAVVYNKNFI